MREEGTVLQIGLPDKLLICRKCRDDGSQAGRADKMLPERALLCSLKSLIKVNKKIRTVEQDYLDGKEAGKVRQVSS